MRDRLPQPPSSSRQLRTGRERRTALLLAGGDDFPTLVSFCPRQAVVRWLRRWSRLRRTGEREPAPAPPSSSTASVRGCRGSSSRPCTLFPARARWSRAWYGHGPPRWCSRRVRGDLGGTATPSPPSPSSRRPEEDQTQDFTAEQDNLTPVNGWKAYYAATKSVVDLNAQFFDAIKNRSPQEMKLIWLQADYVKCIHGSGELFSGYTLVMDSWERAFDWIQGGQGGEFEIQDVRPRLVGEVAWVTMNTGPFHVTNIFELHDGRWYMVHHHSSLIFVEDGDELHDHDHDHDHEHDHDHQHVFA